MNYEVSPEAKIFSVGSKVFVDSAPNRDLFEMTSEDEVSFSTWAFEKKRFSGSELERTLGSGSKQVLSDFVEAGVIKASETDDFRIKANEMMGLKDIPHAWESYVHYHISVHDFPFFNMGTKGAMFVDNEIMQRYRDESEPPSLVTQIESNKGMQLTYFEELINEGKIKKGTLCKYALNCILDFALGIRRSSGGMDVTIGGRKYWALPKNHKVVPSGGGRHPTDAFVVIKNLTGFGGGLLHFDTSELQLRYISEGDEIVNSLSIVEEEVIVVLCPEYLRAMWRYRDPRSFRAVPVDVGHVVGAIEIMSSFLEINAVQTFCFNSQTLKDQIGVLGESQVPMVVMRLSGRGDV